MMPGGDLGLTRVICQRVFDIPETICHSVFSHGLEICHYGACRDFSSLPLKEGEGAGRAQICKSNNERSNTQTALQIPHVPKQ